MQTIAVLIAIALAAGFLAWRAGTHLRGRRTGCGCDSCPGKRAAPPR